MQNIGMNKCSCGNSMNQVELEMIDKHMKEKIPHICAIIHCFFKT